MKLNLTYSLTKTEALKLNELVSHGQSMHEYVTDLVVAHINTMTNFDCEACGKKPKCADYATCGSTDMYPCSTCENYRAPEGQEE